MVYGQAKYILKFLPKKSGATKYEYIISHMKLPIMKHLETSKKKILENSNGWSGFCNSKATDATYIIMVLIDAHI